MQDMSEVRAKLPQMAAFSSTFEMFVPFWHLVIRLVISDVQLGLGFTVHESVRVIVPRIFVNGLRNRAISSNHWRPCMRRLRRTVHIGTTHGVLVSKHLSLCVARRRHPTPYAVHCSARHKTSVHRDLFQWCHEIHLQNIPYLARASALSCQEQFLLERELASVAEDKYDQTHTSSWSCSILRRQTCHAAVALLT